MTTRLGLRERKKLRTRETIVEVALRLFATQGYDETTIAQIADEAEVSPSTFFAYFPTKEAVVFDRYDEAITLLADHIERRPPEQTTVDAFDEWVRRRIVEFQEVSELGVLRYRVIHSHDGLQKALRHRFSDLLESALCAGYARDLGDEPDSARPRILAGATLGGLSRFEAMKMAGLEAGTISLVEQLVMFDALTDALRAGLAAVRERGSVPEP
jgi:AcrR family transcriptional regulator